jgi:hypothetical protein
LVGSVVVRKDAWSDILRFHNDRQKDDNVIRRLGSELISGEELEQMEGAIDGSANDPAEAAIWEIDTSLPELLLASSKEIAEIG